MFKFSSMKNMTALLWHLTLVFVQDFTSPDPLIPFVASSFDKDKTFGRMRFPEMFEMHSFLSSDAYLVWEEKAVQLAKQANVDTFEHRSFEDDLPERINEAFEHVLEHQRHMDRHICSKADTLRLAQQIESVKVEQRESVRSGRRR